MKIVVIPDDLVFSPCKVDSVFWQSFHALLAQLGNPQELVRLKEESEEKYFTLIEPLMRFIQETEQELHTRGYLKEVDLAE